MSWMAGDQWSFVKRIEERNPLMAGKDQAINLGYAILPFLFLGFCVMMAGGALRSYSSTLSHFNSHLLRFSLLFVTTRPPTQPPTNFLHLAVAEPCLSLKLFRNGNGLPLRVTEKGRQGCAKAVIVLAKSTMVSMLPRLPLLLYSHPLPLFHSIFFLTSLLHFLLHLLL